VPTSSSKTTTQQQPSDAIQKAMEATLASIALPAPAASAPAAAAAASSPVVALSDRCVQQCCCSFMLTVDWLVITVTPFFVASAV